MKKLLSILLILIAGCTTTDAQIFDKIKKTVGNVTEKVSLKKLQRDPVSTSFSDVDKRNTKPISFGDTANYVKIQTQPFTNEQGFQLTPGYYETTFHSFCIKAGTYAPTSGSGRFYAELDGPKADIFETILHAFEEGRVEKKDAQLLFWAIIAKTDFAKMKGSIKATALRILSTEEIARLSTNALENLGKKQLRKLSYKSNAVRAIIEAENNLRSKYYNAVNSYAEYEEIAMLTGVEPVVSGWESGKWTKHPDGYYLRYYPTGYAKTKTQVYVPENAGTVYFNGFGDVAVPAHTSSQRLLQSNKPVEGSVILSDSSTNPSGQDLMCREVIHPGIKKVIEEEMVFQNISGMTVGVIHNGEFVHLAGHGHQDLLRRKPLTVNSSLKWASISKTLTAVSTFQLINENADFDLSDLVTDHVDYYNPPTTNQSGNITLQHLISNRSGITQYGTGLNNRSTINQCDRILKTNLNSPLLNESSYNKRGDDDGYNGQSAVSIFGNSPIDFIPGANYLYSSYGFNLLGAAIDEVAEDGYFNYIQDNIADKIGMTSLATANRKHTGYNYNSEGVYEVKETEDYEARLPSGGWESTSCDLAKFGQAILTGELLPDNQNALWTSSYSTNCGGNYQNGIYNDSDGTDTLYYHGGDHNNLTTDLEINVTDSIVVAIQIPFRLKDRRRIAKRIMNTLGKSYSISGGPKYLCAREDIDTTSTKRYSGVWRKNGNGQSILRRGLTHDEFLAEYNWLTSKGYRCIDFEPSTVGGNLRWDGVFQKGSWAAGIWRNYDKDDFNQKWKEQNNNGFQLIDLETYTVNNKRKWAGLFKKQSGKYALFRDFKTNDFEAKVNDLNAKGYHLIDVEAYRRGSLLRWAGVWVQGDPVIFEHGLSTKEFGDRRRELRNEGYKLIDIEHYKKGLNEVWAGVWEKISENEKLFRNWRYCDLMEHHDDATNSDFTLIDFEQ